MNSTVLIIFALVYLGMLVGKVPGLMLDRTGIALLGAIALIATGEVSPAGAWGAIDVPTIGLLFGLMVVSAQFRLGGFYTWFTRRLAELKISPAALLALVIASAGVLSALLCNDIICLAMAPVLTEGCLRRRLDPVPFLLALACAANVGSAATLIGNPQNMLIGQMLHLDFGTYLLQAIVRTVLGMGIVWLVICWRVGDRWTKDTSDAPEFENHPFKRWQTVKGFVVLAVLVGLFLTVSWPREVLAIGAAGVILASRKMASRSMLQLVDWQLLVLFAGLFIVNHALAKSGNLRLLMESVQATGVEPAEPIWLFGLSVTLSNLVSNVPATMLLLPAATHPLAGPILALSSTLAGNLLIVGSIANMIVVDQAARFGIQISWREHARIGVPVTIATLVIALIWLMLLGSF